MSVFDIASLVDFLGASDWEMLQTSMAASAGKRLFLATKAGLPSVEALRVLTRCRVRNLAILDTASSVSFPKDSAGFSGTLAGHSYPKPKGRILAMAVDKAEGVKALMNLGEGAPCFVALSGAGGPTYVWSTLEVFDIEALLERESEFEQCVDQYLPAIIFLREAFGQEIWHTPWLGADLVIDDPLLARKYGFLEFSSLLDLAAELGVHVTVAFIPWNYRRTRQSDVADFARHQRAFGVCAHGCDHTKGEFRSKDYEDLLRRSHLAAQRMESHEERTRLDWQRVMVCPREEYSIEGIKALSDSGEFIAMSNMGCLPRDLTARSISGASLLTPMNTSFFGFPIVKRYGFSDFAGIAMAAFLGKPAVVTAHHDDFRDSLKELREHLSTLSKAAGSPDWREMASVVRRTCQQRRLSEGVWQAKFFADELEFHNPAHSHCSVTFIRNLPDAVEISSLTVNGGEIPFVRENGAIRFEWKMEQGALAHVKLKRRTARFHGNLHSDWRANIGVGIRRFSSELRDKWLAKNRWALRLANRFMRMINLR